MSDETDDELFTYLEADVTEENPLPQALAFCLYLAALLLILCAVPIVVAAWRWGLGL